MKKIFILTGEPSGDKLASKVISKLQKNNPNIEYSCVGGTHLNSLGIKSIFDLKEITYIGFTSVILNLFKIRNKINHILLIKLLKIQRKQFFITQLLKNLITILYLK